MKTIKMSLNIWAEGPAIESSKTLRVFPLHIILCEYSMNLSPFLWSEYSVDKYIFMVDKNTLNCIYVSIIMGNYIKLMN